MGDHGVGAQDEHGGHGDRDLWFRASVAPIRSRGSPLNASVTSIGTNALQFRARAETDLGTHGQIQALLCWRPQLGIMGWVLKTSVVAIETENGGFVRAWRQ